MSNTYLSPRIAVQTDGMIVVAGTYFEDGSTTCFVYRLDELGQLDPDFAVDGIFESDQVPHVDGIALQGDGKILVVGSAHDGVDNDLVLLRLTGEGELDSTFANDGAEPRRGVEQPPAGGASAAGPRASTQLERPVRLSS